MSSRRSGRSGASRRQVLGSILVEALVVGVVASVVGLFLGLLLARGLFRLFDLVGFTLPNTGLVFETRTAVVALVAGILVTLIASLRPAIRATRVPPIAAVREGSTLPPGRFARFRWIGAVLMTGAGFAALVYGLFGSGLDTTQILIWMGLGALLIFLGVALFSSRLVRPLAELLGWPATQMGGAAGFLARDNARRNPQRTASTAAALMIGLALVTLVATLAAGIVSSFRGAVNDLFTGDFAITAQNNFSPIPIDAAEAAAKAPGVIVVGNVRTGEALRNGDADFITAVDPGMADVIAMDWIEGSQEVIALARRRRCVRRRRLGEGQRARSRLGGRDHVPERHNRDVPDQGRLRPAHRRLSVRTGDDLRGCLGRAGAESAESLLLPEDGGWRDRREPGRPRRDARRLPQRQGADASGVHRQPDLGSQLDPEHPLRAARALDHREPVRNREHARADGVRAHARDRDAACDRHDADGRSAG